MSTQAETVQRNGLFVVAGVIIKGKKVEKVVVTDP